MLTKELKDKLKETLAICDIHHQRMKFAYDSIKNYFPLTETNFGQISQLEMALFDQLIYRFSKLQDSIGTRLFKQLLESLEDGNRVWEKQDTAWDEILKCIHNYRKPNCPVCKKGRLRFAGIVHETPRGTG